MFYRPTTPAFHEKGVEPNKLLSVNSVRPLLFVVLLLAPFRRTYTVDRAKCGIKSRFVLKPCSEHYVGHTSTRLVYQHALCLSNPESV